MTSVIPSWMLADCPPRDMIFCSATDCGFAGDFGREGALPRRCCWVCRPRAVRNQPRCERSSVGQVMIVTSCAKRDKYGSLAVRARRAVGESDSRPPPALPQLAQTTESCYNGICVDRDEEGHVSLPSLLPARRPVLALIGLATLTLIIVVSLVQAGTGAAALSLFQSPSSPVSGQAQPTAAPVVPAAAEQPMVSSGLSVPTWAIVVVAAVVIVAAIVVFTLVRRARR
jgi:hypothetical protein